jgi:hypothetical protein
MTEKSGVRTELERCAKNALRCKRVLETRIKKLEELGS